jgi:hypothetical protein
LTSHNKIYTLNFSLSNILIIFLLETELNNYEYSMVRGKGFTR